MQEWGTEEPSEEHEHERDGGGVSMLFFSPSAMRFGLSVLGAAHAATVTIHNTANSTLHLASVSGSTSDFYASFFDTKVHSTTPFPFFTFLEISRTFAIIAIHKNAY